MTDLEPHINQVPEPDKIVELKPIDELVNQCNTALGEYDPIIHGEDKEAAYRKEGEIVDLVVTSQQRLLPGQRLILDVDLTERVSGSPYDELPPFKRNYFSAPEEALDRLSTLAAGAIINIQGVGDPAQPLVRLRVTIPQNRYPEGDLGVNTSASRGVLLTGVAREYCRKRLMARSSHLEINPTGEFITSGTRRIFLHPSLIRSVSVADNAVEDTSPDLRVGFIAVEQ